MVIQFEARGRFDGLSPGSITRDRAAHTLSITQPAYIKDVIRLCGLEHAWTAPTPLNPGTRLGRKQCPTTDAEKAEMAGIPFRKALGQLLCVVLT